MHVLGWIFLYLLPYLFSFPGLPNYATIFSHPGDYVHIISFVLLVLFSYAHYFIFIPAAYAKKSYFLYCIIIALGLTLIIVVPQAIIPKGLFQNIDPRNNGEPMPLLFGMNYTILLFIASVFTAQIVYSRRQLQKIENEKLNAEVLFLKAQINPHFLFNTLNSIYALAINKDDKTPDAIIHLSELMRYVIKDANENLVPLEKEITYINNYIALQRSRLGDTAAIDFVSKGNATGKKIVPLILISFIENAFKHGVNPDERSEIKIHLSINDDAISLEVTNKKVASSGHHIDEGVGLKNSRERLQLLYPGRHTLLIRDNGNIYSVNLIIELE